MVYQEETPKSFEEFYLSDDLKRALKAIRYVEPTPVQASSIPLIMAGIDLIVQSQTGTGKTAAFAIPVIDMLEPDPGQLEVLVLAPTRELAKQVSEEFSRLSQYKQIEATAIYGGAAYEPQLRALKKAQIVCATPGRLLDLLKQGEMSLAGLRFLILDEADEMLSMGFERDLRAILEYLPEDRQSLLFSATVTEEIKSLAGSMLFYPEFLSFSSDSVVNEDVTHTYYPVAGVGRMRDLIKVLEYEEPETAIVFANTKDDTFLVTNFLKRHGYSAEVLNGDLPQPEREKTLRSLRAGEINYLVATDVAARGIDITDLSHVINYVLPDTPEVYVHRTGRTGRAGNKGQAISLVSPAEMGPFIQVRKHTDVELQERELPTTQDIVRAKQARAVSGFERRIDAMDRALTYGSKLGLAKRLIRDGLDTEEERVRLIAKLLAMADEVIAGRVAHAPAAIEDEQPESADEETEQVEARGEQEEEERSDRRRARRSRRDDRSKQEDTQDDQQDAQEEDEDAQESSRSNRRRSGRGRRSRSRGDRDEDSSSKVEEQENEQDSEEQEESNDDEDRSRRSRGGRRRRRGRGSDRNSDRGSDRDSDRSSDRNSDRSSDRRGDKQESEPPQPPRRAPKKQHDMTRLYVNAGKNQFDTQEQAREFLLYHSGMDAEDFGEIKLERSHAFVEVRRDYSMDVISALDNLDVEGGSRLSVKYARSN